MVTVRRALLLVLLVSACVSAADVQQPRRRRKYRKRLSLTTPAPQTTVTSHSDLDIGATGPCRISILDMPRPFEPLVLCPCGSYDVTGFKLPDPGEHFIQLQHGERLLLACPGTADKPNMLSVTLSSEVEVSCYRGSEFLLPTHNTVLNFSAFSCSRLPVHTARDTGRSCGRPAAKFSVTEIGFQLSEPSRFYKLAEICRDPRTFDTYYAATLQIPQIWERNLSFPNPPFLTGRFYNYMEVDQKYAEQREMVIDLVNSTDLGEFYIKPEEDVCNLYYLTPGHLAPPEDFVYEPQRRAMFWYINTAPQWETVNRHNWFSLEKDVRSLATTRGLHFLVYTGTHGTTTLTTAEGSQAPLAMAPNRKVRVPHLFWKVVVEPMSNRGVAFVTMNNPYYLESCDCQFKLCEDVCSQLAWVTSWQPENVSAGLSYCCSVPDLSRYVTEIPDLYVTDLLT